jgi:hypothetical protein
MTASQGFPDLGTFHHSSDESGLARCNLISIRIEMWARGDEGGSTDFTGTSEVFGRIFLDTTSVGKGEFVIAQEPDQKGGKLKKQIEC